MRKLTAILLRSVLSLVVVFPLGNTWRTDTVPPAISPCGTISGRPCVSAPARKAKKAQKQVKFHKKYQPKKRKR